MKSNAIIIFVRNPILGKVKTRLAKTIGDIEALKVYNSLLEHTMQQTENLTCDKFLFYDTIVGQNDIFDNNKYIKKIQTGNDLGEKMENAFQELFQIGYKNIIIIGSDLFDLNTNHIENAFLKMENHEVVIGPAEDGGYYLLGLKKIIPLIFKNKNWGTETVLKQTLENLTTFNVSFLETLNDIDTFEDLEKHQIKIK